jgi:hypothetical protein
LEFQILDKIYILIIYKCWLDHYITCHCQWIENHKKLNETYHESRYNKSPNILQNLKTTTSTIYKLIFFPIVGTQKAIAFMGEVFVF